MKKNVKRVTIPFFILMLLVINIFSQTVSADATIENWNDWIDGTQTDTKGDIDIWREADTFEVDLGGIDNGDPTLLELEWGGGDTSVEDCGRMNITGNSADLIDEYKSFSFWSRHTQEATSYSTKIYIYFYNATDDKQIGLRIGCNDGNDMQYAYQDSGDGWNGIGTNVGTYDWSKIIVSFISPNIMRYRLLDENEVLISVVNGTWCHLDTFENFTYMTFHYQSTSGAQGNAVPHGHFDEFTIDTTNYDYYDYEEGYDCRCANPVNNYASVYLPESAGAQIDWACIVLTNPLLWQTCIDNTQWDIDPQQYVEHETVSSYSETIADVLLPIGSEQKDYVSDDVDDYTLFIDGTYYGSASDIIEYGPQYALLWEGVDHIVSNEKIHFAFGCSETIGATYSITPYYWYSVGCYFGGFGNTKCHNSASLFSNDITDGTNWGNARLSVCWCSENISFPDEPSLDEITVIEDFDDEFGDGDNGSGYMEFYMFADDCYYRVGDQPIIVYNFSGPADWANDSWTYQYYLYRVDHTGTDDDIIYYGNIEIRNNYTRNIETLPVTFNDTGQFYLMVYNTSDYGSTRTNFIHKSLYLTVCSATSGSGDDGIGGGGDLLPDLGTTFGAILGIILVCFFTLMPLALQSAVGKAGMTISIPLPTYTMMGSLGMILSYYLGLFALWVFFFAIAIALITLGFMYLLKVRDQGA